MKSLYINFIRALRRLFSAVGFLGFLEQRQNKRFFKWLRSLFAIYDFDDLVSLDLPWWNMNATDKVESFLRNRQGAVVFEYGSGSSTVWLAKRAGHVFSVEHSADWFGYLNELQTLPDNVTLRHVPADDSVARDTEYASGRTGEDEDTFRAYVKSIADAGRLFDLIIIDGRARAACLREAKSFLADGGMIVFDNAGRSRYQPAIENSGMEVTRFSGLTSCLPYPDQTYLLSRNASAGEGR